MSSALDTLHRLGAWSLTDFWIPLGVWTLVALPIYLILRCTKQAAPAIQHDAHRALLMALPLTFALIPLARLAPFHPIQPPLTHLVDLVPQFLPQGSDTGLRGSVGHPIPGLPHLLGVLSLGALLLAIIRLVRLLLQSRRLRALRGAFLQVADADIVSCSSALAVELGITRPVVIMEGPDGVVPCTFGHRRPAIVLPRSLLHDEEALRVVLEHELTHVARADYRRGWLEQLVASAFALHPLVTRLQNRIVELREQCCDAAVLSRRQIPPGTYAQIILRFGARDALVAWAPAPAIVHPLSNLKTRIDAMKNYKHASTRPRRWTVGVLALVVPAVMSACSTGVHHQSAASAGSVESEMEMKTTDVDLARLQVQMEYLTEELNTLRPRLEAAQREGDDLEMMPEYRRFRLLQELYMQRLGAYETMKMEKEADRRLGIEAAPGT
jgi:beta-lactamase regulating signal transducer with metallopeptidase domain